MLSVIVLQRPCLFYSVASTADLFTSYCSRQALDSLSQVGIPWGLRVPNGHFSAQWERCVLFKLLIVRVYLFSRCSQRTGFRPMGTPMREVGGGSARLNGPECRHSTVSYHCQDDLEMKAMDFRRYEKWKTTGISH